MWSSLTIVIIWYLVQHGVVKFDNGDHMVLGTTLCAKTDRHDITETLLKGALNIINPYHKDATSRFSLSHNNARATYMYITVY